MIKIENQCVSCGLPCIFHSCPYYEVRVHYCDECGDEAGYFINDEDLCEDCARKILLDIFQDQTVTEQAKTLKTECQSYE